VTAQEREVLDRISLDDITDLTQRLVRARGENPPGGEASTVGVLAEACDEYGLACSLTEVEPDRENLVATLAGGPGPGLLLLGHTDVVPIGDGWTVDPVGGVVRDGRLFGRGSTDMKGGLAAAIVAMAALRTADVQLSGRVELAAVVDEEETGKGVRHYLAAQDRSNFIGCIVAEPTDLQTIVAARGDAYFAFAFHGRAAHSGRPSEGVNAIYGATALVAELETWHQELMASSHPLAGPATWSVGQIRGGTGTSIVPAECLVVADRRLLPDEAPEELLESVNARVASLHLEEREIAVDVQMTMEMPGFETPADHRLVVATDHALTAAGGPGLPLGGWTAACDGGFIARDTGLPVVVLGPGSVADQAHRADESVALEELLVAARTYALVAMRLLRDGP
jgi:acetylornithine deacetylase